MSAMSSRVPLLLALIFSSIFVLAQSTPNQKTADTSQEAFVFEQLKESVRFENDGDSVRETTAAIRIQSEAGVKAFGQLVFGYSTANEDLKIDYVRVRTQDGQVLDTASGSAQDFAPEILQEAPMYSDFRERHVSVVGIKPGVTLEYHTVTTVKPLAPGEFWYEYSFPENYVLKDATLQIDIPKSREIKLKSPEHKFETREDSDRLIYTWAVKDFIPNRKKTDEEVSDTPDVQLSSFTSWQEIANWYAKLQSDRAVPDQPIKKKAAELTRNTVTPEEKSRILYNFVAQNIRYVSLSFGVGRFQPHAASEVLQNGYGDCKDKHTLLQAMLAAEGIQSYPVLIHSDRKLDSDVPSPAQFDHVITAVKLDDKLTWLDTTAEVAPYGLIAYQLRNKEAVIAATDSFGGLHGTPIKSPVKNVTTLNVNAKFNEFGALDAQIDLNASGDLGWPLKAVLRRVAEKDWPQTFEYFSKTFGMQGEVSQVKIDAIDDTTKPFHVSYHLHKADYFKVPNSGTNFQLLPPVSFGQIPKASKKAKNDEPLNIGPAQEIDYHARAEFPANFVLHVAPDVSVTRDYGEYSTSYKLSKNVLEAERRMVLKVNELPAFRRADYESFHNVTTSAVEETPWCSIKEPSTSAEASAADLKGTPAELREAGESALKRQDFAVAATLLQRAADQEPGTKNGWEALGQAYAGLNQHAKAEEALRKELEADPSHPNTNAELARELQQLGRFDDAIAAYHKEIEIAPSNKSVHKQLGLLLVQLNRDPEARTELETAASLPPEDPEVKMALSQLYSRLGESTKATTIVASLTGGSVSGSDFFAPALRDDVDPNQAEHDAMKTLGDIGDQFDAGEYDRLDPGDVSAMDLVALSWARLGWANFLRGDNLEASRYLEAAWSLSLSGTVANRLARVYEKTGARDHARHMYALAFAAGGAEATASREHVARLGPQNVERELTQATAELEKLRTVTLPLLTSGTASARFEILFDNSSNAEKIRFIFGDEVLRNSIDKLEGVDYPVKFPDISSIKIIRLGTVSCRNSKCKLDLEPLKSMERTASSEVATAPKN